MELTIFAIVIGFVCTGFERLGSKKNDEKGKHS